MPDDVMIDSNKDGVTVKTILTAPPYVVSVGIGDNVFLTFTFESKDAAIAQHKDIAMDLLCNVDNLQFTDHGSTLQ